MLNVQHTAIGFSFEWHLRDRFSGLDSNVSIASRGRGALSWCWHPLLCEERCTDSRRVQWVWDFQKMMCVFLRLVASLPTNSELDTGCSQSPTVHTCSDTRDVYPLIKFVHRWVHIRPDRCSFFFLITMLWDVIPVLKSVDIERGTKICSRSLVHSVNRYRDDHRWHTLIVP